MIDGEDVRRSYSICSAVQDRLRVAIKRVHGGLFSTWANECIKPGVTLDVMPPKAASTCRSNRTAGATTWPSPPAAASRRSCRSSRPRCWPSRTAASPAVREPRLVVRDLPRRADRPEGPVPGAPEPGLRDEPRAAGHRAVQRPHHRGQMPPAVPALAARGRRRLRLHLRPGRHDARRLERAAGSRHAEGAHPHRAVRRRRAQAPRKPRRTMPRRNRATDRSHRDHGRQPRQLHDGQATRNRCSTPACARASTCATRARAACARPAAARCWRAGGHGRELRAGGLRSGAGVRVELPEFSGDGQVVVDFDVHE
jgi:hypothetical protein